MPRFVSIVVHTTLDRRASHLPDQASNSRVGNNTTDREHALFLEGSAMIPFAKRFEKRPLLPAPPKTRPPEKKPRLEVCNRGVVSSVVDRER